MILIMSGINSNIDTIHVQTGVTTLDQLKEKRFNQHRRFIKINRLSIK